MNRLRSMSRRIRRGKAARAAEDGFTLIELMISIILLAVVSTAFLAATNSVYDGIHKEQGVANALDGNRRALQLFDKQVRYALAINTPGLVGGTYYIEYQWIKTSTTTLDARTCTQWKLGTDDRLQYRTWSSDNPPATVQSIPAWVTVDTRVINDPTTQPPFVLLSSFQNGVSMQYQQLQVNLIAKRDTGTVNTTSTMTALNTPNSAVIPAASAPCQLVGGTRP